MLPSKPVAALETEIGKFRLTLVSDDYAWAFSEFDQDIIRNLALSKMVKVTFETVDGVTATDNFSTKGFALALDEAKARCGVVDFVS